MSGMARAFVGRSHAKHFGGEQSEITKCLRVNGLGGILLTSGVG